MGGRRQKAAGVQSLLWSWASFCRIQGVVVVSASSLPVTVPKLKTRRASSSPISASSSVFCPGPSSSARLPPWSLRANTNMCLGANWKDLYTRFKCLHATQLVNRSLRGRTVACVIGIYWRNIDYLPNSFLFSRRITLFFPLEPQVTIVT